MKDNQKERIYAVHEREIEIFLEKIGVLEEIKEGNVRCAVCGRVITIENFGAIFYKNGERIVVCDNVECIYSINEVE